MNSFRAFVKEKGLYLVCLALIFAATATGIWAVRRVVTNMADWTKAHTKAEEEPIWQQPETQANTPVQDVPKPTAAPSPSSASSAASPAQGSSSGVSSAPSAAQSASAGSAASSTPAVDWSNTPVDGKVSQPFSNDALVYNPTLKDWRTHNGVDYTCALGAPVKSCAAGTVTAAAQDALWGDTLEITDADGIAWKYCGLQNPAMVQPGDKVEAGAQLGTVGAIPAEAAAGTHLHLETTKAGAWQDPAAQMGND